jgi:hypothetical protein
VVLLDASGKTLRQTLTGDDGAFVLEAPRPGSYAIRVERMGYRVWSFPGVGLSAGEEQVVRFAIPVEPIPLEGLEALGTSECPADPAERAAGYALYEEARGGLRAVVEGETRPGYLFVMQLVREGVDTTETWRITRRKTYRVDTITVVTPKPLASLTPEELARDGYASRDSEGTSHYYAPTADVLLSDEFLATHCLGVAARDDPPWTGFTFTPMPGREVPDVAGVLWLDRASREPRRLEFQYTRLREFVTQYELALLRAIYRERLGPGWNIGISQIEMEERDFGGALSFDRLRDGSWITRSWEIRLAFVTAGTGDYGSGQALIVPRARALRQTGTVVAVLAQPADTSSAIERR